MLVTHGEDADTEIASIMFSEDMEITDEMIEAAARQMAESALEMACRAYSQMSGKSADGEDDENQEEEHEYPVDGPVNAKENGLTAPFNVQSEQVFQQ